MKVCYFGIYNPDYARNRILLKGLKENGVEVIEVNSTKAGLGKYLDISRQLLKLKGDYDFLLVAFPGYQAMVMARFLSRKKIVFDAFNSIYDSTIIDRKQYKVKSLPGLYYWLLNWLACKLADQILLDTSDHIDYFVQAFKQKKEKFHRLWISADLDLFHPRPQVKQTNDYLVHFHGSFIPLQGIEYILEAAEILKNENIVFNLVGKGQTYKEITRVAKEKGLAKINFIGFRPVEEVPEYMAQADLILGIFGNTPKAKRVIPNKVYEGLAMQLPVITGESEAAKELLVDRENILFCNFADGRDLADKILILKNDQSLSKKIAQNGYDLITKELTAGQLGSQLVEIIKQA